MKKIYTTLLSLIVAGVGLQAEEIQTKVSLTLYDLTETRMNETHTDSEGNAIKFTANPSKNTNNGIITYLSDIDNPLECVGEIANATPEIGARYTKIIIDGTSRSNGNTAPNLLIDLTGVTSPLTHIELSGVGSSPNASTMSDLICAFSTAGTSTADFNATLPLDEENGVSVGNTNVQFGGGYNCNVSKVAIPEGTQYIKLASTTYFGNVNSNVGQPISLYAIRFYVEGTVVGIEDNDANGFDFTQQGNSLDFSADADVQVYSLTGSQVLSLSNVSTLDLNGYTQGLYIVKAQSKTGETIVKKIALR